MNNSFPSSARQLAEICERGRILQQAREKAVAENIAHRNLQTAGALANIESRDQLIEQNKLVIKQLAEQTEISQRLEREFAMGAREAVITRKIAYWSLVIGVFGLFVAIMSLVKN